MIFREPGFWEALFVGQEPSLLYSDAVLMVVGIDQVACKFEVCATDIVFDAVSEPPSVQERLALAVVDRGPGVAVGVNATLKTDLDSSNPAHANLVESLFDMRVVRAEAPDLSDEILKSRSVDFEGYGLAGCSDHDRINRTL